MLKHSIQNSLKCQNLFFSILQKQGNFKKLIKIVDSYCQVNIISDGNVTVRPFNVFECQDSNKLRYDDFMEVDVQEKSIKVANKSNKSCLLEVPIKANLNIKSEGIVSIDEMYSDTIKVNAIKGIKTKNLRNTQIELLTTEGDINCKGLLLGKDIKLFTNGNGKVILDKVQGDQIKCETKDGNISTQSCYAENSIFITDTGDLHLKNPHKQINIQVKKKANILMTGVHGNLTIQSNGGKVNLQLSEMKGKNLIKIDDDSLTTLNISELIEESCDIEINSAEFILNNSLSHLTDFAKEKIFRTSFSEKKENKLSVNTKGRVEFGKLSWAETMKISLDASNL